MERGEFEGRVALVTGSSRGIGRAAARAFAQRGADVVVHYRRDEEGARQVCDDVGAAGHRALLARADLQSADEVAAMMDRVGETFGRLDILVANAASTAFRPLLDLKPHNVTLTMQTVVQSFVLMAQRALPLMAGRPGTIVTVSGIDTLRVMPSHGLLGAAKAALEMLTRYLAVELASHDITVNGVNPGFVDTESARLWAEGQYEGGYVEGAARWARETPLGRVAEPDDIARVILLLCSRDARWITGQTIVVDGGWSLT